MSRRFKIQTGSVLSDYIKTEEHRGFVLCFSCETKEEPEQPMFPPDQHFPNYVPSMQMILYAERSRRSRVLHFSCERFPLPKSEFFSPLCAGTSERLCSSGESRICCVAVHPQGCNISASVLCVTAHLAKSRATDMEITDSEVDEDACR